MPWQQLECIISSEQAESLMDYLESVGALAITLLDAKDNPIFEPEPGTTPLWQQCKLIALFEKSFSLDVIQQHLKNQFSVHAEITNLADKAWERECMDQFQPMQFGEKLWICPSWHRVPKTDAIVVDLDPGLAFGTGSHPTTRLCLEWLATHELHGKTLIDYGCGSGILAIAAVKLGAHTVYATDIDPQALQATQENAARNQLSSKQIHTLYPDQLPALQADVLIANILATPLITLASTFSALIKPRGHIALSGILMDQIDEVRKAYQTSFLLDETKTNEGWGLISGVKQNA